MVNIECILNKRDVTVLLTVIGITDPVVARDEVIKKLENSELSGDIAEGPWAIDAEGDSIGFENEMFGATIHLSDIERAIKVSPSAVSCGY